MRIDVIPTKKVNGVEFGMDREKVRALLGNAIEFYKFEDDDNSTDDFGFCHVYYDKDDRCEAIEIFNDSQVFYNNNLIFPTNFEDAIKTIPDLNMDDDGLVSYSQSIGVYAPDGEMESILLGKDGYYEEE